MTLLDDARRLAGSDDPVNGHNRCHWCDEFCTTDGHAPACPWLALPRIVAALEAAERVAQAVERTDTLRGRPMPNIERLLADTALRDAEDALVAALGGEGVTA